MCAPGPLFTIDLTQTARAGASNVMKETTKLSDLEEWCMFVVVLVSELRATTVVG